MSGEPTSASAEPEPQPVLELPENGVSFQCSAKSPLTRPRACATDRLVTMDRRDKPAAILKAIVAGLVAVQVALLALAVSSALHKWLHHDADESDHQCAVTVFNSGQIDLVVTPRVTSLLSEAGEMPAAPLIRINRWTFRSSILEHAPPASV